MTVTATNERRGAGASTKERRQPDPDDDDRWDAKATANSSGRSNARTGSGTNAPNAMAAAIPHRSANVDPTASGSEGDPMSSRLRGCSIRQPHGNNDELDLWEDVGYVPGTTRSTVRRVLVSTTHPDDDHGGAILKATTSEEETEEDSTSDEDRASPTSVTAGPGETNGVGTSATTNRDPKPGPAKATAAPPIGADSGGSVDELRAQLHAADLQRQKMAANLRKKKAQLDEADAVRKALEAKVADLEATLAKQQAENDQLRAGLQKVVVTRDDMKNKLRTKNELLRELKADKDEAERRLRRSENQRATEQDLLANYRKLATHTGYFKWGKTIRVLESALEAYNSSAEGAGGASGGGGGGNSSAHSGGGNASNGGSK